MAQNRLVELAAFVSQVPVGVTLKRVLIISYHWPPAGGVTVLRALRFAKHLRDFGWEPVIATATPNSYEALDPSLCDEVPPGLVCLRIPAWRPHRLYKSFVGSPRTNAEEAITSGRKGSRHQLALWVRANAFIPDAKSPWIKPATQTLARYLETEPVDAIFTSGPPHTNTEVASRLQALTGLAWLADFQDPWSQLGYFDKLPLTTFARRRHLTLEHRALSRAKAVTAVSPTWANGLRARGALHVESLPWGFDEADFIGDTTPPSSSALRLCHLGTTGSDRDLSPLLDALNTRATPWSLEIVGSHDTEAHWLKHPHVKAYGFLPRHEALGVLSQCHIAVVWINRLPGQRGRIPAKLYECLRAGKPILLVGDPLGDAARLLQETRGGITVHPDDVAAMVQAVEELSRSRSPVPRSVLAPYESRQLTARVAATLQRITTGS